MKNSGKILILLALAAPAFADSVTFSVAPQGPAVPGSNYVWDATIVNNTGEYLIPTFTSNDFPISWIFNDDFSNFETATLGILGPGSGIFQIDVEIPLDAIAGAQIGNPLDPNNPCCTFTLNYDLYADTDAIQYDGSFTADSGLTSIVVASNAAATPEPTTLSELAIGLAAAFGAAWARRRKAV
jgi:hypothetical protein